MVPSLAFSTVSFALPLSSRRDEALHRDYCQHHLTLSAGWQFHGSLFFVSLSRVLVTASRLQAPLGRGPREGPPGGPTRTNFLIGIPVLFTIIILSVCVFDFAFAHFFFFCLSTTASKFSIGIFPYILHFFHVCKACLRTLFFFFFLPLFY